MSRDHSRFSMDLMTVDRPRPEKVEPMILIRPNEPGRIRLIFSNGSTELSTWNTELEDWSGSLAGVGYDLAELMTRVE